VAAMAVLGAGPALALDPGGTVDNFRLLDHRGGSHELYYLSDMKAVVLMSQGNGCDASTAAVPAFKALRDKYRSQGVEFLMINSNLKDTRDAIAQEAARTGIDVPILLDDTQLIGESLGLQRSGEVFVIDPQGWKVKYRGPVEKGSRNRYTADALDAVLSGKPVKKDAVRASGCSIKMPETGMWQARAHSRISYEKTIAPMLIDNCVVCHRQGGIGPWQMSGYQMVQGFAPMIREVLRTERMPPWHADPHYNTFKNDRSLSKDEVKTLVHWIEAGAPRGKGGDPLAELKKTWPEWQLGEPDLIVEIPAFDVPATGTIPYQTPSVKNPLDHDVWIRAVDFQPGDRTVLHHIIATAGKTAQSLQNGGIGGYVPGAGPTVWEPNTGVLISTDANFFFQMHYTATGKAATDVSRMGLYFYKEPPKYATQSMVLAKTSLKIPPGVKEHTEQQTRELQKDVLVYSLLPHSHFRGSAASFVAKYPDGHEETLLSVPKYDFNWQTTYELKEPKVLPKGTTVIYSQTWDNSTQNKANPDPTREVPWGEQTWDEMLYGVMRYRVLEEAQPRKVMTSQVTPER
jgi:hypothetical protein